MPFPKKLNHRSADGELAIRRDLVVPGRKKLFTRDDRLLSVYHSVIKRYEFDFSLIDRLSFLQKAVTFLPPARIP